MDFDISNMVENPNLADKYRKIMPGIRKKEEREPGKSHWEIKEGKEDIKLIFDD